MSQRRFGELLADLRAAATVSRARLVATELREILQDADDEQRADYRAVMEGRGWAIGPLPPARLRIGETWLLLHEPPSRGRAVRVRVRETGLSTDSLRPPPEEVERAFRGLLATVAAEGRGLPWTSQPSVIEVDLPRFGVRVEGGSLGLSIAVALLSAALRTPPTARTAASAVVREDGRLCPVEHLPSKIDALQRLWSHVENVVVASEQALPPGYECSLRLVRASSLREALGFFELNTSMLERSSVESHEARIGRLKTEVGSNDALQWSGLASQAWESACLLAESSPRASAEGMLLATLFANHAGDVEAASAFVRGVSPDLADEYPDVWARKLIAEASAAIDGDSCRQAIVKAQGALQACENLQRGQQRELLGQALGTLGRAFMHAGDLDLAEPLLRRAMEHHAMREGPEGARSACYLATCLRLLGNPQEALALLEPALTRLAEQSSRWDMAETTRLYLRLERGRTLAALGRWDDAVVDLRAVRAGQHGEIAYPKLGAMRSLATALRTAGASGEADEVLGACISVAKRLAGDDARKTLLRVAAIAAGEAMMAAEAVGVPLDELKEVWSAAFPSVVSSAEMASAVAMSIY